MFALSDMYIPNRSMAIHSRSHSFFRLQVFIEKIHPIVKAPNISIFIVSSLT